MNKQIYRCVIIFFVNGNSAGGSMFLRALDKDHAANGARKIMEDTLKERGYPKTDFKVEVYLSSEAEIVAYRAKMNHDSRSDKMVN